MKPSVKRGANGYRIGDSHHNARLTDHEVELIRQLRGDGMKVSDLAHKFSVSKGYISKVLRHALRR
jgi:Mor family transcriptional regulator